MLPGISCPGSEEELLVLEPLRRQFQWPSLLLRPGRHTVGSGDDCTICLRVDGIQREHCIIESSPCRTILYADNSRTWHNEGPVRETPLRAGDRLALGPIEFRVRAATPEERHSAETERAESRPAEKPAEAPLASDVLPNVREESKTLPDQSKMLRKEIAELEHSRPHPPAEPGTIEPLLEEETRKTREELQRERSSLHMESTLLREQRQRMELRERALIAQRRELEEAERHVIQRENAQEAERARLENEKAKARTKLSELGKRENQFATREKNLKTRENQLKTRLAELELERRQFEEQRASAAKAAKAEIAGLQADRDAEQKRLAEDRQRFETHEAELRQRESTLAQGLAELAAQRQELEHGKQESAARQKNLEKRIRQLEAEREWLEHEFQSRARAQAQVIEGYARFAEDRLQETFARLTCREVELNQLLRIQDVFSQNPNAGRIEEQQEVLERQNAIMGVAMQELAAMKRTIDRRIAEQAVTFQERKTFEETRQKLEHEQKRIAKQQKQIEESWERLQAAEAEFQRLADEEQITLEETRRSLVQREAELKANRTAWERQKESLIRRYSQPSSDDLQAERAALDAEYCQLTQINQELDAATKRLHEAQWKLANDRVRQQKRAGELAEWEHRLRAVERQRNSSIERLTGLLAELNTQDDLADDPLSYNEGSLTT